MNTPLFKRLEAALPLCLLVTTALALASDTQMVELKRLERFEASQVPQDHCKQDLQFYCKGIEGKVEQFACLALYADDLVDVDCANAITGSVGLLAGAVNNCINYYAFEGSACIPATENMYLEVKRMQAEQVREDFANTLIKEEQCEDDLEISCKNELRLARNRSQPHYRNQLLTCMLTARTQVSNRNCKEYLQVAAQQLTDLGAKPAKATIAEVSQ